MSTLHVSFEDRAGLDQAEDEAARVARGINPQIEVLYVGRGTAGGLPALVLAQKCDDGTLAEVMLTARDLLMLAAGVQGRVERDGVRGLAGWAKIDPR